jgi:hypothetical protein
MTTVTAAASSKTPLVTRIILSAKNHSRRAPKGSRRFAFPVEEMERESSKPVVPQGKPL